MSLASYPPAQACNPQTQVYADLQLIGGTASDITARTGRLLPYLFTLIPPKRDGYFLLPLLTLTDNFLLGRMMHCVVGTFLPEVFGTIERPTSNVQI